MGRPKQWLDLCGESVLAHTLCALQQSVVDEIIVAIRPEDEEAMRGVLVKYGIDKTKALVYGGQTRQQSVLAALAAVSPQATLIAVHDGARPLVTPELIARVAALAARTGAAAPGIPMKDTCKCVDENGRVVDTPDRRTLRAVQTPQIFDATLYRRAVEAAVCTGGDYTDDCQLIERTGHAVFLCDGDPDNLKITTPEDVLVAVAVLEGRKAL
jgi:2-C-methyl-D-erythritol 4-phosphate cytidylyltransferase